MLKKILKNFQSSVGFTIINILIVVYTLKYIGANGRGNVSLFVLNVSIISIFTSIIGNSSIGYVINRLNLPTIIYISTFWAFITSIIIGSILYFLDVIPEGFFTLTIFSGFLSSIVQNFLEIFLIKNEHYKYNSIKILQPSVHLILSFFFIQIYDKLEVSNYIFFLVISQVLNAIYASYKLNITSFSNKIKRLKATFNIIFKIGIINQINNFILLFNFRICFYFINYLLGITLLGIFSIAILISESIWIFSRSASLIFFAEIVKIKDNNQLNIIKLKMILLSFCGTLLILTIVLITPNVIYKEIFGKDFSDLKIIILFFSPAILLKSINTIYFEFFAVINKRYINTISSLIGFFTMLIFGYLLTYKFGLNGAALAGSISQATSLLHSIYANKKLNLVFN